MSALSLSPELGEGSPACSHVRRWGAGHKEEHSWLRDWRAHSERVQLQGEDCVTSEVMLEMVLKLLDIARKVHVLARGMSSVLPQPTHCQAEAPAAVRTISGAPILRSRSRLGVTKTPHGWPVGSGLRRD